MRYVMANGENIGYGAGGASKSRRALKGMTAKSYSAREDIDLNNMTTRQRSRVLFMSAPIARSAISLNRTNIVGSGLALKCRIDSEILGISREKAHQWEKRTEAEFKLWAEDKNHCDATGVNDFNDMQQLALITWLLNGDCPVLIKHFETTHDKPYGLRLHIIEPDRISTPEENAASDLFFNKVAGKGTSGNDVFDGVEIDKNGSVVAYHVSNEFPIGGIYSKKADWVEVPAYGETGLPNMLFIMNSERPEQYRGVSLLAPVIEAILQIKRYTESELTAAVVTSFYTVFVKSDEPANLNPVNETNSEDQVSNHPNEYEMGPGNINYMEPGEDVVFAEPKRPSQGFNDFVNAITMQIGAALEIPKELLLKEFGKSYSASRAALLEAWKAFKMRRSWFANDFCMPTYELFLSEAIARGRIQAKGFFTDPLIKKAWLGTEWIGPSQGQIDPVKEVKAYQYAIAHGWVTNEQVTAQMSGGSWTTNMEQLKTERKKMQEVFSVGAVAENSSKQKEEK